jgi:hypothetical protein
MTDGVECKTFVMPPHNDMPFYWVYSILDDNKGFIVVKKIDRSSYFIQPEQVDYEEVNERKLLEKKHVQYVKKYREICKKW